MTKQPYKEYTELSTEAQQQAKEISQHYNISVNDLLFNEDGSIPLEVKHTILREEQKNAMKVLAQYL